MTIHACDCDPDEHLAGTPWDAWRRAVAACYGCTPADVSRDPDAYPAFNTLVAPGDYHSFAL